MPALISVVMPAYNRKSLIIPSLESVRNQKYRPVELILVDDGSTDGTYELASSWNENVLHERLAVRIVRQPNRGAHIARNKGAEIAAGQMLAFLDSDDLWHPSFLYILAQVLSSNQKLDLAFVRAEYFSGAAPRPREEIYRPEFISQESLSFFGEFWVTSNTLYRKESFVRLGGWSDRLKHGYQDRELCLRMKLLEAKYARYNRALAYLRGDGHDRLSCRPRSAAFYRSVSACYFNLCRLSFGRARSYWIGLQCGLRFGWFLGRSLRQMILPPKPAASRRRMEA